MILRQQTTKNCASHVTTTESSTRGSETKFTHQHMSTRKRKKSTRMAKKATVTTGMVLNTVCVLRGPLHMQHTFCACSAPGFG